MMDKQQLQAIEQRWAGKKWTAEQSTIKQEGYTVVFGYSTTNREIAEIAAAPTDIALLLAEVKRLQAENSKYKDAWILQEVRAGNFKEEAAGNG